MVCPSEYTTPAVDSLGRAVYFTGTPSLNGIGSGASGVPVAISTPGTTFVNCNNTLHGGAFLSSIGEVWVSGGGDQGQLGVGDLSGRTALTKILNDARGLPFNNISIIQGAYIQVGSVGAQLCFFVKRGTASDTVLVTGARMFGMGANNSTGADTVTRPTIAWALPSGRHVTAMTAGVVVICLLDDGTVWDWGAAGFQGYLGRTGSYTVPGQVTGFDGAITQIVGGAAPGWLALSSTGKLWGISNYAGHMGNAGNPQYTTPHDLTDSVTKYFKAGSTQLSITQIAANSLCFHVICNDGSLWGWGDNGMGSVGNGVEANLASPPGTSGPWFIDPSQVLVLPQTHPVQVTNRHDFIYIPTGCQFAFATFALTSDGVLHSCGRNKSGIQPNGNIECSGAFGDVYNYYPNSFDVVDLSPLNPYGVTSTYGSGTEGCKTGAVSAHCVCSIPTTTPAAIIAGGNTLTTSATSIAIDGTPSTSTGGVIMTHVWTSADGSIRQRGAAKTYWDNLTPGVHTIMLTVKDNGFNSATQTLTVTVTGSPACNCIPSKTKIQAH